MKLCSETLNVLRCCAQINPGLKLDAGNVIKTTNSSRDIFFQAEISETIPEGFCIYYLTDFNKCLSILGDDAEIDLSTVDRRYISMNKGKAKFKYMLCHPETIVFPQVEFEPDGELFSFNLTKEEFDSILKGGSAIKAENIVIRSQANSVVLEALDDQDSQSYAFEVSDSFSGADFMVTFKADVIFKILNENYKVSVHQQKITVNDQENTISYLRLFNEDKKLEYRIATSYKQLENN